MRIGTAVFLTPVALALLTLAGGAQAQAAGDSAFSFSGFGTLGLVKSSSDTGKYALYSQPRGADTSVTGEVDSKLGLQVTARANAMFSGTVQVLTKQDGKGKFTPGLEWAFVKAQVSPNLALRLGRMGGPFFAVSDFRDVGYANTWLRPPQDVYGQVPVSHFDGADVSYQTSLGSATVTAQLYGGKSSSYVTGVKVELDKVLGFNASAELEGGVTLRVGHVSSKLTAHSTTLATIVAGLRNPQLAALSPRFAALGNELDGTNKTATFTGIGASYDQGDWLANFEYTQRRTDSYVSDTNGWYFTLGHRFGKFTPYLTLSKLKVADANAVNDIPAPTPGLAQLKGGVSLVLAGQATDQKTTGLGLRWDAYRNIAIKAQYERIQPKTQGLFLVPVNGTVVGNVNVYSIAVDTVF